jgi:hypothetical protein
MAHSPLSDLAPDGPDLTAYDRDQMPTYLRLIDAADDGADWREAVEIIFGVDPNADLERARATYDSHLARARWISAQGYQSLVWPKV